MLSCWIDDPNMRPSFAQLQTTLGQLATKDKVSMKCVLMLIIYSTKSVSLVNSERINGL